MKRNRCIIYVRVGLADDQNLLVREAEGWAKKRRLVVSGIVVEGSSRQKRLLALIARLRSCRAAHLIVSPSLYHFSMLPKFLHTLARLDGIGVGLVRENVLIRGRALASLQSVANHFVAATRFSRSQAAKEAHQIRRVFNKRLGGRERLPTLLVRNIESLLRSGLSLRQTVKELQKKGKVVSRSSVANVRRAMAKREGE